MARRLPQWADARYSLGSVYARIDRVADAITELRAAARARAAPLSSEPAARPPVDADEASWGWQCRTLKTAVDIQPASAEAKRFLGEALSKKEH